MEQMPMNDLIKKSDSFDHPTATFREANLPSNALLDQTEIIPEVGVRPTTVRLFKYRGLKLQLGIQTRKELWAYYLFYFGANGLGAFSYIPSAFQNLVAQAGYDPDVEPVGSVACGTGRCVLHFLGSVKSIDSVVLDSNGIAFALQLFLSFIIGAYADYGNWRPWILITCSIVYLGSSFGWLGIQDPSKWQAAVGLYILGQLAGNFSQAYFIAAHAASSPVTAGVAVSDALRTRVLLAISPTFAGLKTELEPGLSGTPEAHSKFDALNRNKVANISYIWCSLGATFCCLVAIGILRGLNSDLDIQHNNKAYSVIIVWFSAVWIVCAPPWLLLEQKRPGQQLPPGSNYFTVGFKNLRQALIEVRKLKQTLLYLIAFFILSDTLNTAVTIVYILQYDIIAYSMQELNYLNIITYGCETISIWVIWEIQRRWGVKVKTILLATALSLTALCAWGLAVWSDTAGFKRVAEIWVFQAYFGLIICQWYICSFVMIGEVVPRTKVFLFFSLFAVFGKTSSFIGPFITSAIITDAGGNTNMAFAFLLPMAIVGGAVLWLVDTNKSQVECKIYLEKEAADLYNISEKKGEQSV